MTRGARSLKELLVVVPHSGVVVPAEIDPASLSPGFAATLANVDWYTDWLYQFRDVLDNQQLTFPYCSILLEANRHPDMIDDAVPLRDVFGAELYDPERVPSFEMRTQLASRYLQPFHQQVSAAIGAGAEFLLDAHSTIPANGVAPNQIDLMNFQHSVHDEERLYFSPMVYIETYAEELARRLPEVHVTVNASEYYNVYGHVCAAHSINAIGRVGRRVPAICQETCHALYMNSNGTADVLALDHLRRAFADALHATLARVRGLKRPPRMIELHNLRQTYDFDCGAKALQGVLAFYGVEEREDVLLADLSSDPTHGTSLENMTRVARQRGFDVECSSGWTLDQVKGHIDEGRPVIVAIQAWSEKYLSLREWRENYDDGHYVVVIGYDGPVLYFEDPASFHRTWLKENEFMARWHDEDPKTGEKYIRVGLVLHGREPASTQPRPMA